MSQSLFEHYAEHELKYHARKHIAQEIKNRLPDGDPMVTGITVMIGSIIAMAAFSALMRGGRSR